MKRKESNDQWDITKEYNRKKELMHEQKTFVYDYISDSDDSPMSFGILSDSKDGCDECGDDDHPMLYFRFEASQLCCRTEMEKRRQNMMCTKCMREKLDEVEKKVKK